MLAFGGPKTFHRLNCNIEDAGWEIRDTICWLYGQGFPKGHNISKAIDKELGLERPIVGERRNRYRNDDRHSPFNSSKAGTIRFTGPASEIATAWESYSTALKPAWEPILLAQKPLRGSFAKNALQFGCGGLNINECRIGSKSGRSGRWPANLIIDEEVAQELDRQSGKSRSNRGRRRRAGSNVGNGKTLETFRSRVDVVEGYNDEGGASRFFYIAKAGAKERKGNDHPTVKPQKLCEYLARLILPPKRKTPRRLIVPFAGSGSEMLGALLAGWDHVVGIERDPHYVEIARRRLSDFGKGSAIPA